MVLVPVGMSQNRTDASLVKARRIVTQNPTPVSIARLASNPTSRKKALNVCRASQELLTMALVSTETVAYCVGRVKIRMPSGPHFACLQAHHVLLTTFSMVEVRARSAERENVSTENPEAAFHVGRMQRVVAVWTQNVLHVKDSSLGRPMVVDVSQDTRLWVTDLVSFVHQEPSTLQRRPQLALNAHRITSAADTDP